MEDPNCSATIPPFPPGYRASSLLLHVTSLPSPYGMGDVGPAAFVWVDRLHEAGQEWWQALPLGPTGYSNSPYHCLSSFANNGLLISPELLIEDGLLRSDDCRSTFKSTAIDYDAVIPFKLHLLELSWNSFRAGARRDLVPAYEEFCHSRVNWLEDYALFRALKEWPAELVRRVPSALAHARQQFASEIDQVRLAQFLLSHQTEALAFGKTLAEVKAEGTAEWLEPHRVFNGNRLSNSVLAERLTPATLGKLIALCEHSVFTQAAIWQIDAFDQWGVELGKVLAQRIIPELESGTEAELRHDSSTNTLIRRYRKLEETR